MYDKPMSDPNLGLASTRQLLLELKERGITEGYHFEKGAWLAITAQAILESLPPDMLDFRDTSFVASQRLRARLNRR